jgi:hypothetical protein
MKLLQHSGKNFPKTDYVCICPLQAWQLANIMTKLAICRLLLPVFGHILTACTTVGVHAPEDLARTDFGPTEVLRICVLADKTITDQDASRLIGEIDKEFDKFGLDVQVPWIKRWKRPAFGYQGIFLDVAMRPLEPPCDRLFALVGRDFGDFLTGLLGVEMLGAVDVPTHTRGFAVAECASINQIFVTPASVCVHEAFHLLGCEHATNLSECYQRISQLKRETRANRDRGSDFFPGVSARGTVITTRQEADMLLHEALRQEQAKAGHPVQGGCE